MRYVLPQPPPDLVRKLVGLAGLLEEEPFGSSKAKDLLQSYAELVGRDVPHVEFLDYHGAMSVEEFVARTLVPEVLYDPHVSDVELLDLISRVRNVDETKAGESHYWIQMDFWERILEVQLANPGFQTVLAQNGGNSDEEILAKARAGRPIPL